MGGCLHLILMLYYPDFWMVLQIFLVLNGGRVWANV